VRLESQFAFVDLAEDPLGSSGQAGQVGAIANGVILMGCFSCADDITIRAFGDATHVIIDVMGYFQQASVRRFVCEWKTPLVSRRRPASHG
jgi:hypothetical protein